MISRGNGADRDRRRHRADAASPPVTIHPCTLELTTARTATGPGPNQPPGPNADQPPGRLRADAARNRERVLAAAERLFADQDARRVTMEDIARAAGVGRATLYRRYPSPAAVALALLDEHERRLQEKIIRGAPPLGPGAPAAERLSAFYTAMVDLLEQHLPLALGAETGSARFQTGAYGFWRLHVRTLLTADGDRPAVDPAAVEATVDLLLAPLAPELYHFQRNQLGLSMRQITVSLGTLAERFLGGPGRSIPAS